MRCVFGNSAVLESRDRLCGTRVTDDVGEGSGRLSALVMTVASPSPRSLPTQVVFLYLVSSLVKIRLKIKVSN